MKLSTFLQERELSRRKFADMVGISKEAVHYYLHGKRFPRPETLRRIAEATDGLVTANDFCQEEPR